MRGSRAACCVLAVAALLATGCSAGVAEYWWASGARFLGDNEIVYVWNYEKIESDYNSSVGGKVWYETQLDYRSELRIIGRDGNNDRRLSTPGGFLMAASTNLIALHPGTGQTMHGVDCRFDRLQVIDRNGNRRDEIVLGQYPRMHDMHMEMVGYVWANKVLGRWGAAFTVDDRGLVIETVRQSSLAHVNGIAYYRAEGNGYVLESEYFPPGPESESTNYYAFVVPERFSPIIPLSGDSMLIRQIFRLHQGTPSIGTIINEHCVLDAALTPVYISNEIYLQQQHGEDLFFVDHWARYHPASRRIRIYLRSDEYEMRGSHVVDLCVDTWTVSLVAVIPRDFYVYDISPDHRYLLGTTIGKNTRIEKNEFGYFALRNVNVLDLETGAVSVLRSMKVKKEGNTSGTMFNYDW